MSEDERRAMNFYVRGMVMEECMKFCLKKRQEFRFVVDKEVTKRLSEVTNSKKELDTYIKHGRIIENRCCHNGGKEKYIKAFKLAMDDTQLMNLYFQEETRYFNVINELLTRFLEDKTCDDKGLVERFLKEHKEPIDEHFNDMFKYYDISHQCRPSCFFHADEEEKFRYLSPTSDLYSNVEEIGSPC
jgi:hypothetical protein